MNILVLGNGGRESAIIRELLCSKKTKEIHVLPENKAFHEKVKTKNILLHQHKEILNYTKGNKIDLVIVGPEKPLVEGLSDLLRAQGVSVFGPSQKGAMLEGSKIFCKEFLKKAGVPTAEYREIQDFEDLCERAKKFQKPWVVKADGLASGKGVFICKTQKELERAGQELFHEKILGEQKVFLEEHIEGRELSYLVLTNGYAFEALPIAQDHKRIFDEDKGPNTGGMGAVAPLKISDFLDKKIREEIVAPVVEELSKGEIGYRGVLYFGLMIQNDKPYVLEINVRFGDPEAQVILPLLDGDWGEVFLGVSHGILKKMKWKRMYATSVVLAAPGYPDHPEKDLFIDGNIFAEDSEAYLIPAGISQNAHGQWATSGGRVMNAVGIAETAKKSVEKAYGISEKVKWKGLQKRLDIGQKVLKNNDFIF